MSVVFAAPALSIGHQPPCSTIAYQADSNGVSGLQLALRHGRWRRPFCWSLKPQRPLLQTANGGLTSHEVRASSRSAQQSWRISGKSQMLRLRFDRLPSMVQTVCVSRSWVSSGLPLLSRERLGPNQYGIKGKTGNAAMSRYFCPLQLQQRSVPF